MCVHVSYCFWLEPAIQKDFDCVHLMHTVRSFRPHRIMQIIISFMHGASVIAVVIAYGRPGGGGGAINADNHQSKNPKQVNK